MAVTAALSQLTDICEKICNKSITLKSLDIIKEKDFQLRKLCDAVNSGSKNMCMTYVEVELHLKQCIELQTKFKDYRNQIDTLLGLCGNISDGMLYANVTIEAIIIRILPYNIETRNKKCINYLLCSKNSGSIRLQQINVQNKLARENFGKFVTVNGIDILKGAKQW